MRDTSCRAAAWDSGGDSMDARQNADARDDPPRSPLPGSGQVGETANAPSDVTSDGEEEIAGLVHAKERAQDDADEDAHGR